MSQPSTPALGPAARTAFYCCALRAADAQRVAPVCGDTFAARFLDEDVLEKMRPMLQIQGPSASNVARHRLIDDWLRAALTADPERRVIVLGAGFDTRAFRMPGGRWWELDSPEVIAFKNARLPVAEAPRSLVRVPCGVTDDQLAGQLTSLAGDDVVTVVLEGVSMYLTSAVLERLVTVVRTTLPNAHLICDLMTPAFRARYSATLRRELEKQGAEFSKETEDPRIIIERAGYRATRHESIVGRARQAGTVRVPGWLLATFLRGLRDGYQVWAFEPR
jgi:methyltransferase (TIGR00027 family)